MSYIDYNAPVELCIAIPFFTREKEAQVEMLYTRRPLSHIGLGSNPASVPSWWK